MSFIENLQSTLNLHETKTVAEWEARPAAVLVPLYYYQDEWHLLFTRRTDHLEEHKGQVAFPGGKMDKADASPEAAALREAEEEIGLRREHVRTLGQLDELLTVTQWRITPVVGVFSYPYEFKINYEECAAVFGVPLRWLRDPAHLEIRQRQPPVAVGRPVEVYYYREYEGHVIWGATARMVQMLLNLISEK